MSTALAAARAKTKGKRMLRDSLGGYGEDEFTISEWNRKKKEAERDGTWTWKQSVTSTNATIKVRFEKDGIKDALKARFVDMQDSMDQEMKSVLHVHQDDLVQGPQDDSGLTQCYWRECIGGKPYRCTNDVPVDKKKTKAGELSAVPQPRVKQFCRWHARECDNDDHPLEKSRAIEIPNRLGLCLHCYEATAVTQRATLQKTPPRVIAIKIPGVCLVDLRRDVKRDVLMSSKNSEMTASNKLTARSVCSWQKEHYEKAFIWQCTNRVLMHPTLNGSYFSLCGFHAPRCIKEYGRKSKKGEICPPIDRLNRFGMCRNHLEAHLSTLNYEQRGLCILVNTEFDVPGIKECSRDPLVLEIKRHPLAPKHPPPSHDFPPQAMMDFATPIAMEALLESLAKRVVFISGMFVKNQVAGLLSLLLDGPNPISALLKEAIWRFQFLRRAEVVAIRIQRIFRGKRGRRRVHVLRCEQAALKRIKACRVIQQFARGFLGRRRFQHEYERVNRAVPIIQRIMWGGLARKRYRELRAAIRLQRNYRCYRQRLAAWALREEMEYMKSLQRRADVNLREMEEKMYALRRLRARRLLRAQMIRWKKLKEAKAHEAALRIQSFWSAVKIQRLWRRHQHYAGLKKRYQSAQCIQKRVRGWLTRHLWKEDPGILFITGCVNAKNGFEYGKTVILRQPSNSYSYPSRRTRMQYGALTIQRLFRGLLGRLKANEKWVEMLKRWEWIGIKPTDSSENSSDSMTVGKERYGFVLPSFNYHKESRRHMKPIIRNIKADRGFAYKYQYILDLIKDRDGKRAWSLAHEQRIQKEEQRLLESNQRKWTSVSSSSKTRDGFAHDLMLSPSISHAKAVFPVGSIVKVLVFNSGRKGKTFRCGKVVRIHNSRQGSKSATSFDIDYDP
uniref:Uncharacterized protein n=1 Tax=Globisporangium ultimum (strain ATCC 200006 / CBS 805.95 / DAOM BR144) TaxID=431595 RepID=K3WB01_GLOUD